MIKYIKSTPKRELMCFENLDEFITIYVLKSGWKGIYHVIEEHGDDKVVKDSMMDKDQIKIEYGIKL